MRLDLRQSISVRTNCSRNLSADSGLQLQIGSGTMQMGVACLSRQSASIEMWLKFGRCKAG